eukprot:TRINITY_DN18711_c0_g1_i1.p4 TRINITY_DN18711_c0_g1~~TRINITY_DN18711_c0_g1_i1.p4  ORF type:complete len:154 (+),score=26.13 TRINITY_DN18711_c0_g1_i1:1726-2187(+)
MNKLTVFVLVTSAISAPLASAATLDDVRKTLAAGSDYGIQEFRKVEFDDDYRGEMEIEGWIDNEWYVELDLDRDGKIQKEQRKRDPGERYGLPSAEVTAYIEAAQSEGMDSFDELTVSRRGYIEVEGRDDRGRELEVDFRTGSLEVIRIERDD